MACVWTYVVVHVLYAAVSLAQYSEVKVVCKDDRPDHCFTLYENTAGSLTWTQAQQLCSTYNKTLATVPDMDTQQYMARLIESGSNRRAWIAGLVWDDDRWQNLDGDIYVSDVPSESADDNDNCAYLLIINNLVDFYSDLCTEPKQPLCQYPSKENESCESDDIKVGAVCLRVVGDAVSWYSAVNSCNELGYSLARYETGLRQVVSTIVNVRQVWLEVYRYPWKWKTDLGRSTIRKAFNWNQASGLNIPGHCLYISDNQAEWKSQLCDSPSEDVRFAICEKDSTTTTTSTTTTSITSTSTTTSRSRTTTTTSTTTPSVPQTEDQPVSNIASEEKTEIPDYVIIIAAVCCLLWVVAISLLIIVVVRRRLHSRRAPKSELTDMSQTSRNAERRTTTRGVRSEIQNDTIEGQERELSTTDESQHVETDYQSLHPYINIIGTSSDYAQLNK